MIQSNLDESSNQSPVMVDSIELDILQEELLHKIMNGSLILGTIIFFTNLFVSIQSKNIVSTILTILLFGILFCITFFRKIPVRIRGLLLSILYYATGFIGFFFSGLSANGLVFVFAATILLVLLTPKNWWIPGAIGSGIIVLLIGFLIRAGIVKQIDILPETSSLFHWVSTFTILFFLIVVLSSPLNQFIQNISTRFSEILHNSKALEGRTELLKKEMQSYELRMDHLNAFQLIARQISRSISSEEASNEILQKAVNLIRDQFGYYYTAIFLSDENGEFAVLRAGTGEPGLTMLRNEHKLRIREEGIVGFVMARGELRYSHDVATDSIHFKNPLLPDTHSEIAIPLKIKEITIGALDIQTQEINGFPDDDIDILVSLADHLALALDRSLKTEIMRKSFQDLKDSLASYTMDRVNSQLRGSSKNLNYGFSANQLEVRNSNDLEEQEVMLSGKKKYLNRQDSDSGSPSTTVLLPILLLNQPIGVIRIIINGASVSEEYDKLFDEVAYQIAQQIENAQLLEDLQERADRENIIGQIANKVRNARDLDSILQTTVAEIGRSLGVSEVRIQLKTQETPGN